jgi:hypothetical protein
MLDRLPAWGRHLLVLAVLAPLLAGLAIVLGAVIAAGGVDVDWSGTLKIALDAVAVSAAGGLLSWCGLYLTPLTRQYGVGAADREP